MDCQGWREEIVECARAGVPPPLALGRHLDQCETCRAFWGGERLVSRTMRDLREAVRDSRSSPYRRALLMDEFARVHGERRWMGWALRAAAAVVLALSVGLLWQARAPGPGERAAVPAIESTLVDVPPELGDDSGFVAVPYAPPLAAGEYVTVVRTELRAEALDRMGFAVLATSGDDYPADVVIGQDGMPRAVRLLGEETFEN